MPPKTIDDFRDHGIVARTVDANLAQARADLAAIAQAGVSLEDVTDTLLKEGIASFGKSFDTLTAGIKAKVAQLRPSAV